MTQDKVYQKLLEHDDKLSQMLTKNEFREFKDDVLSILDNMSGTLERLDQERIFTNEWIKRTEKQIEQNTQDILQIKKVLKLAN